MEPRTQTILWSRVADESPRMPLTVCIPVYNPGPYLLEAVQSVLDQRGVDLDLLVIDDASDAPIAPQLAAITDPRMRIERNPHNLGLVGNWNRCLALAMGDPVLLFHQDDRLRPNFLARAIALLERFPGAGFVFSNIESIDAQGQVFGGHWSPQKLPVSDGFIGGEDLIRTILAHGNIIPCQTVVVRAAAYAEAGHFNPSLHYTPDLEMWLRLASRWGAAYLADSLVEVRRHGDQVSNRFLGTDRELGEVRRAFLSFFAQDRVTGFSVTSADKRLARDHLRHWSATSFRSALRSGDITRALHLCGGIIRMRTATLFGSPC